MTDRDVVTDAVDSQQPGADAVADGRTVRVLFIEDSSRDIFSTHDTGGWQPSTLQVGDILGSWVRGSVYTREDGAKVAAARAALASVEETLAAAYARWDELEALRG